MVLLDLFSGTGGFALGFKKAGFVFDKHYFSEINPHAIANYTYNFPDAIYAGPIQNLEAKKIQAPDLITFGFPCQDLSSAGKQKGLSGKRSGLFFEALRLIRELKPRVFIFENVKGLLSSQEGKDFETVLKEIANLGRYDCQWQLLNTSWFLPQNRERIYFVGCFAEYGSPTLFPFTQSDFRNQTSHEKKAQTQIAPTLDTRVGSGCHWSPYVLVANKTKKKQPSEDPIVAGKKYDQFDASGKGYRSQNDRIYHREFSSPTLTASGSDSCKIYDCKGIRRLTPTECERLQGFPDGWTAFGNYKGVVKKISDTQRYQLLGNAVSVPVVESIARRFLLPIKKATQKTLPTLNGMDSSEKKSQLLKATLIYLTRMQQGQLSGIRNFKPEITFNSDRTDKNGKKAPDGIEIRFGTYRPSEKVRETLKKYGFKFSDRQKMWYAWENAETRKFIEYFSSQQVEVDDTLYEKQQFWTRVKSIEEYNKFYGRTEFYIKAANGPVFYNSKKELAQRKDLPATIKSGVLYFKKFFNKVVGEETSNTEDNNEEESPNTSGQKQHSSSETIAERLRELALNLEDDIRSKLNSATSKQRPTPRRARIAASMREDGYKLKEIQDMLYALAEAHQDNSIKAHPFLENIQSKSQLELVKQYSDSRSNQAYMKYQFDEHEKAFLKLGINNVSEWAQAKQDLYNLIEPNSGESSSNGSKTTETEKKILELEAELIGMKIPGFFPTPQKMIDEMLRFADLQQGHLNVLEPSAGKGDILDRIKELYPTQNLTLHAIEINFRLKEILKLKGYSLVGSDILEYYGEKFDRILMNPPFENGIDIDHVRKAYELLKPGGKLVAIMGNGAFFRQHKKDSAFREWIEEHNGWASEIYQDAFKNSFNTTGVLVRILVMEKSGKAEKGSPSVTPLKNELELLELEALAELEILQMEAEARKRKTKGNLSGNFTKEQDWKVLDFH